MPIGDQQTLRELIQEQYPCSQDIENHIFLIARTWGDRRVAYERDQCAAIASRMHGSDGDQIASAIRARQL